MHTYPANPETVAEGQEAPHTELRPYADAAAACAGAKDTQWIRSLDGSWRIAMADRPDQVPAGFHAEGYDTSGRRTVTVPHIWQTDGLDHPVFRNIPTEMSPGNPPEFPRDVNPTGACVRTIDCRTPGPGGAVSCGGADVRCESYWPDVVADIAAGHGPRSRRRGAAGGTFTRGS